MVGTSSNTTAQLPSLGLDSSVCRPQSLLDLATFTPILFNHTRSVLPLSSRIDDYATIHLHQSSSMSSNMIALLILPLTAILIHALLFAHSTSLPKWLKKFLAQVESIFTKTSSLRTPPIVHIPREIHFSAQGHAAYNKALDDHGDVVIIPRHGRLEYVVDHRHARDLLTDCTSYSFEKAVTRMLHMEFMLWFKQGTFVQELSKLVQDGVAPRLCGAVDRIAPVFNKESNDLLRKTANGQTIEINDMYSWVHHAIAQAMIVLILGEQDLTPTMTRHFMEVVAAIANLSGIYENTQGWRYFPRLWSFKTTAVAITGTILPRFFFGILPQLWKHRNAPIEDGFDAKRNHYSPLLGLLAAKHREKKTERLSLLNFIWCSTVCLGVIFASIHQTAVVAVWCILNLAKRQDQYLSEIRQEIADHIQVDDEGNSSFSIEALRELHKMDSFIREVLRTKGDTFAPVRYTVKDVRVGKYIIPKGSLCAPYVKRAHEHADNHGPKGSEFNGFQWCEGERMIPAVQGSHDFISFGLGRWACPGRQLAIAEIKIILVSLFDKFDLNLQGGGFSTSDPMNATSVAPQAVVLISKRN